MKTSYFFGENNLKSFFRPGWKGMGDPGVEEVETRIFVKPGRGCGAVYLLYPRAQSRSSGSTTKGSLTW